LFFFSSRRRHTRFSRDWSSDVCSSDLGEGIDGPPKLQLFPCAVGGLVAGGMARLAVADDLEHDGAFALGEEGKLALVRVGQAERSEERRVGKECRCGWSTYHKKRKN